MGELLDGLSITERLTNDPDRGARQHKKAVQLGLVAPNTPTAEEKRLERVALYLIHIYKKGQGIMFSQKKNKEELSMFQLIDPLAR